MALTLSTQTCVRSPKRASQYGVIAPIPVTASDWQWSSLLYFFKPSRKSQVWGDQSQVQALVMEAERKWNGSI